MFQHLLQIWLILFTNSCCLCQNRRYKHSQIKRNILIFNNNNNSNFTKETTDVTTKQNTLLKLFTKLVVILLIFLGFTILLILVITVIYFYVTCSRPARIHQQISIEYLDSTEIVNYSDSLTTSSLSSMDSLTIRQTKELN
ncbi:hypothetical protein I4U23_025037 [Adineta vaga]|nr:hypothetical protein I4U23_025037 [Adineta vaga]